MQFREKQFADDVFELIHSTVVSIGSSSIDVNWIRMNSVDCVQHPVQNKMLLTIDNIVNYLANFNVMQRGFADDSLKRVVVNWQAVTLFW